MNESKKSLLQSLACITIAILMLVIGGTIAFTIACLLFAASGALHHKSVVEADLEKFQEDIAAGLISTEEAGDTSETVIDLEELSESDREVIYRVMGVDLVSGEDYTGISEIKQGETKE